MNPKFVKSSEEGSVYRFTLSEINVSLVNALRRIILSEIPINVIKTENYSDNQCHIEINTTRLHNEILKHRLSCIPIHMKELDILPGKYLLEVDVKNESEHTIFITTEDFKIRNKENQNYLTKEETRKIFPPSKIGHFIDFARLRPKVSDTIPGEQLKLTADFSIGNAKANSMFNVVSLCSYGNTPDLVKIDNIWSQTENKLKSEKATVDEIEFQRKNYYILDAQRQFIPDSFDFLIESIGIYENIEIVKMGCQVIKNKLIVLSQEFDSRIVPVKNSETTINNSFDITLENEDYTIGKVLEYILYEQFYKKEEILTFCGFKKFHPHDPDSKLRIAYKLSSDKDMVYQHMKSACIDSARIFEKLEAMF